MNPVEAPNETPSAGPSAGQMLRAAREAKGMHLAMLAVRLKVSVRQIEALEAGRHEELKGVTFERALAQAVCRQLGIDPVPVLAALPHAVQHVQLGPAAIQARRQAMRVLPRNRQGKSLSRQVWVLAVLMLLGAAALIWWPSSEGNDADEAQDPTQAAVPLGQASDPQELIEQAASAEQPASMPAPATAQAAHPLAAKDPAPVFVSGVPALAGSTAAVASAPAAASSAVLPVAPLVLRQQANAWVEVRDSRGQTVVKRMVKAGETLQVSPTAPFFVYIGKADSAELRWQGQPVDLKPHTQNNEARLQIKP